MRFFCLLLCLCLPLPVFGVATGDGPGGVGATDGNSELELWVKADDLALAAGAVVAAWPDASGNGRHLSQPSAGARPVFQPGVLNGRPVVRFTQDYFANLTLPSVGHQFTLVAVLKPASTGAYHNLIDGDANSRPMLWVDGQGNYEFNFNSGAVTALSGGTDLLFAVKRTTAPQFSQLYLNGPAVTAAGASNFTIAASKSYSFFNRGGGQAFTGDVAELIIYSTALTTAEIAKVGWYLQEKYQLPASFEPASPTLARYAQPTVVGGVNEPITPNSPVLLGGGTVTGYAIAPALPAGLSLDPQTGVISGTPTAVAAETVYTVTATFAGHPSSATTVRLSVTAPTLASYTPTPVVLTRTRPAPPLTPVLRGGPVTGFAIAPPLPDGLGLNPLTGVISGTPTQMAAAATYTVTATFAGHPASSFGLELEVLEFSATLDITEFLTSNQNGLTDGYGSRSDWIELHNYGSVAIDLGGWSLTDRANNLQKSVLPSRLIAPGEYLVVFASGESGFDPAGHPHASFSLGADGEYLALVQPDGVTIAREFAPAFPPQPADVSYGTNDRVTYGAYTVPTPGAANGFFTAVSTPVTAAPASRTFSGSLSVTLSAPLAAGAVIRYTLSGNAPTAASSVASGPITLTANARLRARVFQPGLDPGPELSESYLKLGTGAAAFSSNLPILFLDSDAAIAPASSATLTGANAVFIPTDAGAGRASATDAPDYAGRGGLRIRGRSSQSFPQKQYKFETWDGTDRERGAPVLGLDNESNWVLYAPYTDKALIRNALAYRLWEKMGWPSLGTRFVEVFVNDDGDGEFTYADDYAGIYMLVESIRLERLNMTGPQNTSDPAAITGGFITETGPSDDQEFSTTQSGTTVGHKHADPGKNQLNAAQQAWIRDYYTDFERALYGADFKHPATGRSYSDYTDLASQVDYKIAREWSRNFDGGSTYSHVPRGGKLTMGPLWDYNWAFGNVNYAEGGDIPGYRTDGWNRSFTNMSPWAPWWKRFEQNPDWWQQFIDRWTALREGVLSDAAVTAEIEAFTSVLSAEAAGRHFTRWPQLGQFTVISPPGWETRTTYQSEVNYLKNWLRDRSAWIDAQFPPRPVASPLPGPLAGGGPVTLTAAAGQTIYFTTDGSDPRQPGGAVAAGAQSVTSGGSVAVASSTMLTARARQGTEWGAPFRGAYITGTPAAAATLIISELSYHPADPGPAETAALPGVVADDFEFIELRNIGAEAIDLTGAAFTEGISLVLPPGVILAPGGHVAVVKNPEAFALRHGGGLAVAGPYEGNLSNSGETIVLTAASGAEIARLTYHDSWSAAADGLGHTLVLRETGAVPADYNDPANWGVSAALHGSPAADNGAAARWDFALWRHTLFAPEDLADPERSGPLADPDHDGIPNLLEFALGTHPGQPGSFPQFAVAGTAEHFDITFTLPAAPLGVSLLAEVSTDAVIWTASPAEPESLGSTGDGEVQRLRLDRAATPRLLVRFRAVPLF